MSAKPKKTAKRKRLATKDIEAMAKKHRPLTVRQERFCEFIAAGDSQTEAYLKAGWKVTRTQARVGAAKLASKGNIKLHIAALRAPQTKKAIVTKDRKREICAAMMENPLMRPSDRLKAMELDAKLAGDFEPERTVFETGPMTLEAIRARALEVAGRLGLARTVTDKLTHGGPTQ